MPHGKPGQAGQVGFPGLPVESRGFGQLHVVLFRENHISGAGESCEVGNPGTLGACDFFDLACSLWLESWEEHLPTSIAGVLRLRAISRPLCDRSARRFAQDDGFVGGEKHPVGYAENTKRSKKSQALGMTKRGRVGSSFGIGRTDRGSRGKPQISPLRYAPVEMTSLLQRSHNFSPEKYRFSPEQICHLDRSVA